MGYYTYILFSQYLDKYYIGYCSDIEERLKRHLQGNGSTYTKKAKDWELVYQKEFTTSNEAITYERFLKKKKSRKYLEYLIGNQD